MLFNAGEQDALQQWIRQYFCNCIGGILLVIGVLFAEIHDANAVGVCKSIMRLFAYL
jgi:sugar phosphate permease